jgi:hypothetical protein
MTKEGKMGSNRVAGVLATVLLSSIAATSSAEVFVSGAGGVFKPWEGQAGPTGLVQVLSPIGSSEKPHLRAGAEIEYRNYKSKILHVSDVEFNSGSLRAVIQYHFLPDNIDPYVGAGFGVDFNVIDSGKVERAWEKDSDVDFASVSPFGVGLGVLGLLGVEFPLGSTVALFAEGRAAISFQLTETSKNFESSGDIGVENLGGFSGIGGLRVRF